MSTKSVSGSSPPSFHESEKFDGTNYLEWSERIMMACRVRGARGYLMGTISCPTVVEPSSESVVLPKPAKPPPPIVDTPWTSSSPSWDEWDARDAWCLMAICQNVKNAVGLGIKTDSTAAVAWKSITTRYKTSTDLARVYAQRELRSKRLNEGDDLIAHIADLHTKHNYANAMGATIDDADFREIILSSLPASWDPIISTLTPTQSSVDTIIRLEMQWSRIRRNAKPVTSGTSATALKAYAKSEAYAKKQCTNPICNRKGHLIADCYWKGGGKEGLFPPGFGQRGGTTGSATAAATPSTDTPIANTAVVEKAYALMANIPNWPEVQQTVEIIDVYVPPDPFVELPIENTGSAVGVLPLLSFHPPDKALDSFDDSAVEYVVSSIPDVADKDKFMETAMMAGNSGTGLDTLTYADSGASNHCFANKSDFSTYEPFLDHQEGQAASKTARFKIHGKGTVIKTYESDHKRALMTFTNALHTPDFAANLVSISRFDTAGYNVNFGGGCARIIDPKGSEALSVKLVNGMYVFQDVSPNTTAMPARSHEKATSIENWHRRFCHFDTRTIKEMSSKNLVDGLDIKPDKEALGSCEDCIFGKHTSRPYDEIVTPETELLERVHMDLWGPARVKSNGGASYALFMTDGASSMRKEFFFSEKTAEAVLQAVMEYVAEAETQTGKRVKCFRVDNGREFLNSVLEAFCRDKGIRIETPAPYAHAGNGVAERTNRTVLDALRCIRSDSTLPPSYWAEIIAAIIYVLNLMPSRRHPGQIPAERWFGKRQDVSHLRAIGSTAYAKVPKETNPSKLDPMSVKYTLIGYFGRDAYKLLDRATGKVVKARNVIFEEGSGHRTLFDQQPMPLHDDPIFSDEISNDAEIAPPHPQVPVGVDIPHVEIPQAPIVPNPAGIIRPQYPIAPRQQPIAAQPIHRPQNVQLFNIQRPENAEQPAPRRTTRIRTPTAAALDSQESQLREAVAKERGDEWAIETEPRAHVAVIPSYDMDLDALEFQATHMMDFQADLDDYIALLAKTDDETYLPTSYTDAMQYEDLWMPPMSVEMAVMEKRGVFTKMARPKDRKVIGLKWIYGFKFNSDGDIIRRKARLVAQGFNQIPGVDFDKTYAAVARLESMRMCIAIIAHLGLRLWQIDFVAAYLNSENKFEAYTEQAPGFITPGEEHLVYKANKTVYGMMAGAHDWEDELSGTYDALGYYQSRADSCVRHRVINGQYTLNVTYTDDVIGGSSSKDEEIRAIGELDSAYDIKRLEDSENGRLILGMKMTRDEKTGTINLSQRPYLERLLKKWGMSDCNPKYTPLPLGTNLSLDDCAVTAEQIHFMKDKPYREVLGGVMWAQVGTRLDLSYTVNLLARFQINPGPAHWYALMHVLAYIKATLHYSLSYHRGTTDGLKPVGYVDADYAGDLLDTGRSTGAYVFMMAGGAVSWSSKRQETVALSTTEAEYMATSRACQQAVWMYSFMREAGLEQPTPAILLNDNTGSIALTESQKGHKKAKHIHIRYHYIRERVSEGDVRVIHVPSADNLADILTKPLPRDATEYQASKLGLF